jgi:ATP-dependent DNA helicase RecG
MNKKDARQPLDFLSPLSRVAGLGPKRAAALREAGLVTAGDLLYHFPRKYLDRSHIVPLNEIDGHLQHTCTVAGTIVKARVERGKRTRLRALLSDGTGSIELLWFAGVPIYRSMLAPGTEIVATGRVTAYTRVQMVHPLIEGTAGGRVRPFLPLYSISESMRDAGVSHRLLSKTVASLLGSISRFPQVIPEAIRKKRRFPPLEQCLREIHLPSDLSELDRYLCRMRYEELFRLALTLRWSRRKFALPGRAMRPGGLDERFRKQLPFALTEEQEKAVRTLYADAVSDRRMHRLLQGDVGSGKTLAAFFACLPALAGGFQVAWLAPTEVLAMQTFGVVLSWLSPLGFSAELLKGGVGTAERRRIAAGLASGGTRFVVGTHALLEPQVVFRRLGMIVIDEQHKFGAAQRLVMQEKDTASDFLLMSATPIPQTLAQTLYGDLEVVTIRKPPPGRVPVDTFCVPESRRSDMELFVLKEIREHGASAYYVVPRIEHDESHVQ